MKKNGIESNKTNKRDAGAFLLFVFLLPYVCACLWGHVGEETGTLKEEARQEEGYLVEAALEWGVWELPLEEYLAYRLLLVMPESGHLEAKKAQAVLLRTELARCFCEGEDRIIRVEDEGLGRFYGDNGPYADGGKQEEALQESRRAVRATEGEILTYQGEPIRASYFKLSNGSTRSAAENGEKDCPYLRRVICKRDQTSPEYHSVVRVDKAVYEKTLRDILKGEYEEETLWETGELSFDEAGYLTSVSYIDENGEREEIDGETFRHLFGLNAASFVMSGEGESVIFQVSGVGHGFGMSQFEADGRAKDGETYREILADFFFQTELAKFE